MSTINTDPNNSASINLQSSDPRMDVKLEDTHDNVVTQNIFPLEKLDNMSPLETNKITKKYLFDTLYLLSHIAFASVLVICLKNTNPILLAIILSMMLGYISYDEQRTMPIYTLFIAGLLIYAIDLFIIGEPKNSPKNISILRRFGSTIWKLPYYGIMSYYIILYVMFCFKKDVNLQ